MFSILYMAWFNIQKRLFESILIGLSIFISVLLLSTSLIVFTNSTNIYEKIRNDFNTSNLVILSQDKYQKYSEAENYFNSLDNVTNTINRYYWYTDSVLDKSNDIPVELFIAGLSDSPKQQDKFKIVEGETKTSPGENEMWIPTGYAYSNDIKLGDSLQLTINSEKKYYKVTAIFVDGLFSSSVMNPTRVYVSNNQLNDFGNINTLNYMIGVKLNNGINSSNIISDWEQHLGHPFIGQSYDQEAFKSMSTLKESLISAIMLIASFIITLVIILIISFTISSNIYNNYRNIGILISLGYSKKSVKAIYIIQICSLCIIALLLGLLCSKYASSIILRMFLKELGCYDVGLTYFYPFAIVFVLITSIILLSAYSSIRKISKIAPVEAIRYAYSKTNITRKQKTNDFYTNISSLNMIIFKSIFSSKFQSIFIIFIATFISFASLFITSVTRGIQQPDISRALLGYGQEDVVITFDTTSPTAGSELLEKLKADDRVKYIAKNSFSNECAILSQNGVGKNNVYTDVVGENNDFVSVKYTFGTAPKTENEISISKFVSNLYKLNVNDKIKVYIHGKEKESTISGIYSSKQNIGLNIKVPDTLIKSLDKNFKNNSYSITLNDSKLSDELILDYENLHGINTISSINKIVDITLSPFTKNITSIIVSINVAIWLLLLVILINTTILNINKERINIGILKTLGFSNIKVRLTILLRYIILSLIGVLIGIIALLGTSSSLMSMIVESIGIADYPFILNIYDIAIFLFLYIAYNIVSIWLTTIRMLKIPLKELVIE